MTSRPGQSGGCGRRACSSWWQREIVAQADAQLKAVGKPDSLAEPRELPRPRSTGANSQWQFVGMQFGQTCSWSGGAPIRAAKGRNRLPSPARAARCRAGRRTRCGACPTAAAVPGRRQGRARQRRRRRRSSAPTGKVDRRRIGSVQGHHAPRTCTGSSALASTPSRCLRPSLARRFVTPIRRTAPRRASCGR